MKTKEMFMEIREEEAFSQIQPFKNFNKEAIKNKAIDIEQQVLYGHIDPLEALIIAKKIQELGKSIEEKIRPIAEDKVILAKGEIYSKYDVEVTSKVNGSKTDYSTCNDPIWIELTQKKSDADTNLKEREKFLSGISKATEIVINEAEVITLMPPVKSGKIGLALSLK